jgi:cytochrome c-type biogenesis protein CcmH/NrfF
VKEETMPIFILWAVPAAIVLAGGTYLIFLK